MNDMDCRAAPHPYVIDKNRGPDGRNFTAFEAGERPGNNTTPGLSMHNILQRSNRQQAAGE